MGPGALLQVLQQVKFEADDENLLVGLDESDDAIAYQLNEDQVVINSVDFFTPVVNEPYLYGQIAAANALSDIYAMGAKPRLAMNIVGFPSCLEKKILQEILQGGADKVAEAEAILAGGHTVEDDEPKYGLSVTGIVKPENLLANSNAQPGDQIILTKPIGTGIIATAIKGDMASESERDEIVESMAALNDKPIKAVKKFKVNACTDITGFGLLGHVWELASGSGVEITVESSDIPYFDSAREYAEMGLVPEGGYKNKTHFGGGVEVSSEVEDTTVDILFDPQTSGGLLISVPSEDASDLLLELYDLGVSEAMIIGEVTGEEPKIKLA